MVSRRSIRIKVLQTLYSYYQHENLSIQHAEKELFHSIERSYDLFYILLELTSELVRYADKRIDIRMNRLTATDTDRNPNRRFVNNGVVQAIRENENFKAYLKAKKMSWDNYPELIRKLYRDLTESFEYEEYMKETENSLRSDRKMIKFLLTELFFNCEDLYIALEEQSIFWNDDVDYMLDVLSKNLNIFKPGNTDKTIPPMLRSEDDKEFALTLLRKTIINNKEYSKLLTENLSNWDIDRVAYTDRLVMTLAISEIIEFPGIPQKVSFNEWIEIARLYGSDRSSSFVNGVLDKIIAQMHESGRIVKSGRGLIEK